MRRPMIPLTFGVAILDEHTRLASLETGGAVDRHFFSAGDGYGFQKILSDSRRLLSTRDGAVISITMTI